MKLNWPTSHTVPKLHKHEIHVWAVELDKPLAVVQRLSGNLIPDETARAAKFYFAHDRDRYTVGRATLRQLLGAYLNMLPQTVEISYSEYKKPLLPNHNLNFNVSHSHGLGLFVFCDGAWGETAVGIDIEKIRPMPDANELVTHYFSQAEIAKWQTVAPHQTDLAFFNCWTRKEAFIKAIGEGLSHPLDAFDVTFLPDELVQFTRIAGRRADDYRLLTLEPAVNFVGALTFSGVGEYKIIKMSKGEI